MSPRRCQRCHEYMEKNNASACSNLLQSFAIARLQPGQNRLDPEDPVETVGQCLGLEGFAEKAGCAAGHRFFLDAGFGAGGDHDHRQRTMAYAEFTLEFEAVRAHSGCRRHRANDAQYHAIERAARRLKICRPMGVSAANHEMPPAAGRACTRRTYPVGSPLAKNCSILRGAPTSN
jgi:hypothetical protein